MATSTQNEWINPLPGVPDVESPLFEDIFNRKPAEPGWREAAEQIRDRGYAVIDFPDPDVDALADEIIAALDGRFDWESWKARDWAGGGGLRVQDAWREVDAVKRVATNREVLRLLEYLYGREAFAFQTLNFPVGTQQHFHTDSVHFSSLPERFMCGVWLALEDTDEENGPLEYYPGSHKLPIFKNEHIGHYPDASTDQTVYHEAWTEVMRAQGLQSEAFHAKKGQALIWSSNLFHGGRKQTDPNRTRWSQVTHYYFEGCSYYTPMHSEETVGELDLRTITDIADGKPRPNRSKTALAETARAPRADGTPQRYTEVPAAFDARFYLKHNPDVKEAGVDAAQHFLRHGQFEGRRWRK